jgi:hypothetical protein
MDNRQMSAAAFHWANIEGDETRRLVAGPAQHEALVGMGFDHLAPVA